MQATDVDTSEDGKRTTVDIVLHLGYFERVQGANQASFQEDQDLEIYRNLLQESKGKDTSEENLQEGKMGTVPANQNYEDGIQSEEDVENSENTADNLIYVAA